MFNFPNDLLSIVYTKDKTKEFKIVNVQIDSDNKTTRLSYVPEDNPFDQNRISASLNLINRNGTVILKLKSLEYDDDGVFTLKGFLVVKEKFGISVKVQG